jgi:hypothetical protein
MQHVPTFRKKKKLVFLANMFSESPELPTGRSLSLSLSLSLSP